MGSPIGNGVLKDRPQPQGRGAPRRVGETASETDPVTGGPHGTRLGTPLIPIKIPDFSFRIGIPAESFPGIFWGSIRKGVRSVIGLWLPSTPIRPC